MDKIVIPDYATSMNIDIGLSFSACHANEWLKKNSGVFVLGIEALKDNINKLKEGKQTTYHHREKGHYLDTTFIDNGRCILMEKAVVNSDLKTIDLYNTNDPGQCSIYHPPNNVRDIFNVKEIIKTSCCKLEDIIKSIEFNEKVKYIGYIKIDVQGADLDVVKSGGEILKDKVVYITLEPETVYSSGQSNSVSAINNYMKNIGFIRCRLETVNDPTYINSKFQNLYPPNKHGIICIQNN
jgi:hypothetical protein